MTATPVVLHLQSSSRSATQSATRRLGTCVVNAITAQHTGAPHITSAFVAALGTGEAEPLALSNELIDELLGADVVLIECPMHNFGPPSVLKAWVDHVVRAGRTFTYQGGQPAGLTKGKRAILVMGRGGIYSQGPAKAMDHQEPYLRTVLGFIGITDVQCIYAEGMSMGADKSAQAMTDAQLSVGKLRL